MSEEDFRDAQVIPLDKRDRALLSKFAVKVVKGTRTHADDLEFHREISDGGYHKLTTNDCADVAQTAIDALPLLVKRQAIKKLNDTEDGADAGAFLLAEIERMQEQLLAGNVAADYEEGALDDEGEYEEQSA